ncbi:RES family NAD+ phosphorylase [Algoriphagus namhaensis]
MKCFRLIEAVPGRSSLGYGMAPARWNLFGTPILYCASLSSLNFLELLSIKGHSVTQSQWRLVELEITSKVPELDPQSLSPDWKNRPHPRSTQEFGTQWAKAMLSLAIKVPSCRIPLYRYPEEHNVLINPFHPNFQKEVKVIHEWDATFEVNA